MEGEGPLYQAGLIVHLLLLNSQASSVNRGDGSLFPFTDEKTEPRGIRNWAFETVYKRQYPLGQLAPVLNL